MSELIKDDLFYTKEHEWIKLENEFAYIGITDFAQNSLGDIVFVELPELESTIEIDQPFGVVESIKSVSDLFAPLSGQVLETNDPLTETPELINQNPYESWMVKIKLSDKEQCEKLLSPEQYKELCSQ